jgi:hypothetical protein
MSSRSIYRLQKEYKANPTQANLELIFRSQLRLAAEHSIDKHTKIGLLESLKEEKKRRKRGKKLNLLSEEDTGT